MSEAVETPYADRKLGKKEARPDSIKLKLEDFVDKRRLRALRAAHPIRPRKVGHGGLIARQGWAMLGNDHYGCCVWSGAAHETKLWTYEGSNKNTWFRDKDVLADYAQCTGFDPKRPETDVGTDMQKAAKYRQDIGIRDAYGHFHKILAYLAIKPGDLELHLDAIWLFGAVGIGFLVPESAMDQNARGEPWTVVSQSKILSGHYVPAVSWNGQYLDVVTWGATQAMSPQFLAKYNDESVCYLSTEMLRPDGTSLAELARTGGPAWALLFVAVTAIVYLFRQLSKEREMCANDWRTTVAGNSAVIKEWSIANEPRTRALEANVRALELMTAAIDRMTVAVDHLSDVIHSRTEEALQSNRNMREALLKKGVDL
jgi:hypothetical protein